MHVSVLFLDIYCTVLYIINLHLAYDNLKTFTVAEHSRHYCTDPFAMADV